MQELCSYVNTFIISEISGKGATAPLSPLNPPLKLANTFSSKHYSMQGCFIKSMKPYDFTLIPTINQRHYIMVSDVNFSASCTLFIATAYS